MKKTFRVRIRRGDGRQVRASAEQVDGKVFTFTFGWIMDHTDGYPGEVAWLVIDPAWPPDAPLWIASGDLEELEK